MIDKVQKIREEVERIKTNANKRGAISKHSTMVVCDEILSLIDSLQEEPVSKDFEHELYKAFGQVKDFTLGMRIAKWFYDMGKNSQEPVSEELEKAAREHSNNLDNIRGSIGEMVRNAYKAGAKWKKEQIIAKTVETTFNVSLPSGLYDKLWIKGCKDDDKLLVIKKDEL